MKYRLLYLGSDGYPATDNHYHSAQTKSYGLSAWPLGHDRARNDEYVFPLKTDA